MTDECDGECEFGDADPVFEVDGIEYHPEHPRVSVRPMVELIDDLRAHRHRVNCRCGADEIAW